MTNGENKIPTVELSEGEESRNPKGDAKENESRTGIFAKDGDRRKEITRILVESFKNDSVMISPVGIGDARYAIIFDDVSGEWIAERYIVKGVAFFDGKWHCCDNGHEWIAVGSDYCLPADAAKRMLIRLCDDGEKVVDLTRCENVSSVEEDEG